jgi:hypothetical protein
MNRLNLHPKIVRLAGALVVAGSIFLTACGGSSSSTETAGIGGTGIGVGGTGIVSGKITGFGSVHVNGGIYDIDSSQFNVDGNTGANQSDLRLGMVITLEVETENGVLPINGKALEVVYDDQVEGAITMIDPQVGTTKNVHVFGQNIVIDEISTVFEGTSFENIGNEDNPGLLDVIEVSGFRTSATDVVATYVRFDDDLVPGTTEVELRGTVDNYTPGGSTFEMEFDGTVINFDPTGVTTEIDVPGGVISNGMYVEVEGVIEADQSVTADKIEAEDEDFGDDVDDVSLQGIVTVYTGVNDFIVGNQPVDASTAEFKPASLKGMDLQGMNVEVEGEIVGGKLIAEEVEARDGESKLRSEISMVDTVNYEFFKVIFPVAAMPNEVTVRVDGQTLFEDETGPVTTPPFSLDDLMATDFVRVEGQEIAGNELLATVIKRRSPENKLELEGAVDDYDLGVSITILGIEYGLDVNTIYDPSPNISPGDFVGLEDDDDPNLPDGIADEVEIE